MMKILLLSTLLAVPTVKCQMPALIIDKGDIQSVDIAYSGEMAMLSYASSEFVTAGTVSNLKYTMFSFMNADLTWSTDYETF